MMCRVIYWQTQHTLIKGKIKRGWNSVGCQQQQTKKKAGKEMSAISGSRLSAPSASGSQSTTAPIFHMRRSWCGLLEWVSFLGSVCTVCVCVCVVLFMGELHSSVNTLIYGPPLPHLTVRVYVDEIDGSLIQTHTQTYTHLPTYLHGHTITQRIFLNWVKSLGGAGTQDNVFALRDLRCL